MINFGLADSYYGGFGNGSKAQKSQGVLWYSKVAEIQNQRLATIIPYLGGIFEHGNKIMTKMQLVTNWHKCHTRLSVAIVFCCPAKAVQSVKNLARIDDAIWVKCCLDGFHVGDFFGTAAVVQIGFFGHANAMFGRD